jgi:hypothetical protein
MGFQYGRKFDSKYQIGSSKKSGFFGILKN